VVPRCREQQVLAVDQRLDRILVEGQGLAAAHLVACKELARRVVGKEAKPIQADDDDDDNALDWRVDRRGCLVGGLHCVGVGDSRCV